MPEEPDVRRSGPIPSCYWLIDDVLLAGEYPSADEYQDARDKLAKFLDAGIRTFIDLTEVGEGPPKYDNLLRAMAAERGIEVRHVRHAIRDLGVPREREHMTRILSAIREEIAGGRPVYVHCWGGIGRTGTVVGCWLAEEGIAGPAAIEQIAELRAGSPGCRTPSPETEEQRRYVCEWLQDEG